MTKMNAVKIVSVMSYMICLLVNTVLATTTTSSDNLQDVRATKRVATVRLATLEWPPYSSAKIENGGEIVHKVVTIFRHMGYVAKVDVLPWSRAVRSTYGDRPKYQAYFPEYPLSDTQFRLSDAVGISEVGLVQRKDRTLKLDSALSLQKYRLGVVQDYVNTQEIDALIANKQIKPIVAISDRQNLVRVLNGDIDVAVIDKRVMRHLIVHDKELNEHHTGNLIFNNALSEHITLHVAFNRYLTDDDFIDQFNQALAELETMNTMSDEALF
ncbi:substrate-binding periplasmic protein [Rheinheimera fenheensis]|uniref:substrate-binding periplasmic protein n=1 Tax=Rheinheimera fenheensis TaxID=3152295 RepID=UPI00325D4203